MAVVLVPLNAADIIIYLLNMGHFCIIEVIIVTQGNNNEQL